MANLDGGENRFHYQPSSERLPLPAKYTGPIGRVRFAADYVGRVTKILLYVGFTGQASLPQGKEDMSLVTLVIENRKVSKQPSEGR